MKRVAEFTQVTGRKYKCQSGYDAQVAIVDPDDVRMIQPRVLPAIFQDTRLTSVTRIVFRNGDHIHVLDDEDACEQRLGWAVSRP